MSDDKKSDALRQVTWGDIQKGCVPDKGVLPPLGYVPDSGVLPPLQPQPSANEPAPPQPTNTTDDD